jgi:hypothetical protein
MTGVFIERGSLYTDTHTGRTPSEYKDIHLQTRETGQGQVLPSEPPEGTNPHDSLILVKKTKQNYETSHFCCLRYLVCGTLLQQLWEMNSF